MRLVGLLQRSGEKVWVNPDHVIKVEETKANGVAVLLDDGRCIYPNFTAQEVVDRLQDSIRIARHGDG